MKAITHYFAYKHLKLILKEDCSIAEKKRMLRLLLRVYVPEQILANENPNHCSKCGRFSDGNTCDDCQSSASSETSKETKEAPTEEEAKIKRKRKIDSIKQGYFKACSHDEALEALETDFTATDSYGDKLIFSKTHLTTHYIKGERRRNNTPKPENLNDLPKAVFTGKQSARVLKFPPGADRDILNPPPYTQRIYHIKVDRGYFYVFAYHNTGLVTGWHYREKPIELENSMGK